MNTKHYTLIEQSKKLLELGLNPDTADMYWNYDDHYTTTPKEKDYYIIANSLNLSCGKDNIDPYLIPSWSLGALLELMPKIKEDEDDGGCYPTLCKGYNTDKWHCVYRSSIHITKWYDNPIDAAFEMVYWLLEKGYIKKGE